MKKLFLITIIILCGMVLKAQETFFPTKEGTVLIYKTFDKKDKLTNTVKYTIKHVKISGSNIDITYEFESIDSKDKLVFKEDITIHQKGDKLYFDMSNFINKAVFQQNGEIPAEVEIKGNNMEIPLNPQPGDILPDANVEMALKMGFMNMKISADLTNRKVEAMEEITVKGGTFKCYKLSGDINSSAMGIKVKGKSTEWYAKGVGIVKSESYDKNGALQSHTELVEMK
jgi:predicted small secreted protein